MLLLSVVVLGSFLILIHQKNKQINALEEKIMAQNIVVYNQKQIIEDDLEAKISILSQTVKVLEKEKENVEEKLLDLKKRLRIDHLEKDDISKIGDISANTPLDLETSAILVNVAKKYDLKPSLILSIMELESNFDPYVVGRDQDRGYMQIIPSTEKWLANEFASVHQLEYDPSKIFEPAYNIELAATYLSLLKKSYGNDYNRILSEYNRGPYNLAKYYEEHKTYETKYSEVILKKEKKYLAYND